MKKSVKLVGHIKHFIRKNGSDKISAIAGQSAFYIILSFVPFLMFAFALLSYFGVSSNWYYEYISMWVPSNINEYIGGIIDNAYESAVSMAYFTIITALWSSGRGIYSITEGVLTIYKSSRNKNWFVKRLQAMLYTFIMFVVIVLSMVVLVLGEFFQNSIISLLSNLSYVVYVIYILRYVIMFVILVVLIAFALKSLLYFNIKDKSMASFRMQLPGAILLSLSWIILSAVISIYTNYFGGFSLYGSLGVAAVIMIWLYFAMYLFLCSIQFNYIYRFRIHKLFFKNNKK